MNKYETGLLFTQFLLDEMDMSGKNILEVGSSVRESVSIHLNREQYKQFLISEKVRVEQLKANKLNGARGLVFKGQARYIDESIRNSVGAPISGKGVIRNTDILLCRNVSNEIRHAIFTYKTPTIIVGDCITDIYKKSDLRVKSGDLKINVYDELYEELVKEIEGYRKMYKVDEKKFELKRKIDEKNGRAFYLIKNK